jgi:hypothetical protein
MNAGDSAPPAAAKAAAAATGARHRLASLKPPQRSPPLARACASQSADDEFCVMLFQPLQEHSCQPSPSFL